MLLNLIATSDVNTSTSTQTSNKPTGTLEGHLMIAFVFIEGSSGLSTAPSWWSLIWSNEANIDKYYLYYKVAWDSEPASYSWTYTWYTRNRIVVLTYSWDYDKTNPINISSNTQYRTNDQITRAASMNVTKTWCTLLVFAARYNSSQKHSTPWAPVTTWWATDFSDYNSTSRALFDFFRVEWTSSWATGLMDMYSIAYITAKHWFAIAVQEATWNTWAFFQMF